MTEFCERTELLKFQFLANLEPSGFVEQLTLRLFCVAKSEFHLTPVEGPLKARSSPVLRSVGVGMVQKSNLWLHGCVKCKMLSVNTGGQIMC